MPELEGCIGYIPLIDYAKSLFWNSEQDPLLKASKVIVSSPYSITNISEDYGSLCRPKAAELLNSVVYVNDLRHSHDLDTQDLTIYSMTGTTETTLLTIDYGSVLTVKEIYVIIGVWSGSSGFTATANIYISSDGSTWTKILSAATTANTEQISRLQSRNLSFRYLKVTGVNASNYSTNVKLRKVVITI
jgi:hypothetical protein